MQCEHFYFNDYWPWYWLAYQKCKNWNDYWSCIWATNKWNWDEE